MNQFLNPIPALVCKINHSINFFLQYIYLIVKAREIFLKLSVMNQITLKTLCHLIFEVLRGINMVNSTPKLIFFINQGKCLQYSHLVFHVLCHMIFFSFFSCLLFTKIRNLSRGLRSLLVHDQFSFENVHLSNVSQYFLCPIFCNNDVQMNCYGVYFIFLLQCQQFTF